MLYFSYMITKIKKMIPRPVLTAYHIVLAYFGAFIYGFPSRKLIVIGVTGTNGKSTTVSLIARALESGGDKVGAMSTVYFKVGEKEKLNDKKMTMLGRLALQKYLHLMVKAGCKYAVIETSSQGIIQNRHRAINYDYVVFTNLTPEHIEAHGGFENYKKAKGKLFQHLTAKPRKNIFGQEVPKAIIVNDDDEYAGYFLSFPSDRKITYAIHNQADWRAREIAVELQGTSYEVNNFQVVLKLIGEFNVYNSLPALIIAHEQGLPMTNVLQYLKTVSVVPGRMELIDQGQNFYVLVDYAPEPYALKALYRTLDEVLRFSPKVGFNNLIHVLGSCGGGRDVARRPILGKMAGEKADIVIITNEDPYDDDPREIMDDVAQGAIESGKILNQDLFLIEDRREAIAKALSLAQENDLVLVTGKGSEQAMAIANGKYLKWDDRKVIREELQKM